MYSLKSRIRHLLALDMNFRNDDKLLWLKLAEDDGLILDKKQRAVFLSLPSQETVARRRREMGKEYPASITAQERRYKHYVGYLNEFSDQRWLSKLLRKRGIV